MDSREFQELKDRFNGLCGTVEGGFREIKGELRYRDKADMWLRLMFAATTVLSLVSVLIGGYAVSVANANRSLVIELVRQVNDQARTISQTAQEIKTIKTDEPPR